MPNDSTQKPDNVDLDLHVRLDPDTHASCVKLGLLARTPAAADVLGRIIRIGIGGDNASIARIHRLARTVNFAPGACVEMALAMGVATLEKKLGLPAHDEEANNPPPTAAARRNPGAAAEARRAGAASAGLRTEDQNSNDDDAAKAWTARRRALNGGIDLPITATEQRAREAGLHLAARGTRG